MVTNRTFERAPWADVLVGNDAAWWCNNHEALRFPGIKLCVQGCPFAAVMMPDADEVGAARAGGNSGYTAAWCAGCAGPSRILLCGFDFRPGHWHGEHPKPLRNTSPETFKRWAKRFEVLAADLKARGIDVRNCTPGSALQCFPFADLKEVLNECETV